MGLFACLVLWFLGPGDILPLSKLILPDYCYQDEEELKTNIGAFIMPFLSIIPAIIEHTVLLSSPLLKCSMRKYSVTIFDLSLGATLQYLLPAMVAGYLIKS